MKDDNGKTKGFGFVAFDEPEAAEKAVNELNDSEVPGLPDKKPTVCRAQKRWERQAEMKRRIEEVKAERAKNFKQGVNLYVKNLVESVTDEKLRELFEPFGTLTSTKVMLIEGTPLSRGFGFVCFERTEDATKAVAEMNSKMFEGKPLYVTLAQRREDRKAQL
jgi:polyadenylate-binding protein